MHRFVRVLVTMAGITAAAVVAVAAGVISLPNLHGGAQHARPAASATAMRSAADRQWAASTCTNLLEWKKQLQRDGTSFSLGFGPVARIQNAIAATRRMAGEEDRLGLPPGANNAQAQADARRLRAEAGSRLGNLERAASNVASGNLAALGTLLGDLKNDQRLGTQFAAQLRRVVSVDLGLSLVQTSACRQLVGSPV